MHWIRSRSRGDRRLVKTLIIEGWRFFAHSYALVNQWQLLALSRRNDVHIKVVDAPIPISRWETQPALFDERKERLLRAIERAGVGERADATLRIVSPFDFSPSKSHRTTVFGTSESQTIRRDQIANPDAYEALMQSPPSDILVVTPSRWSAEGFLRAGFKPEQVFVVPHGADIDTFRPMPDVRSAARKSLGFGNDEFLFLTVGAMTGNKGIDLLIRAFAEVCQTFPNARLVLKGMEPLYDSEGRIGRYLQQLSAADRDRVTQRLTYTGYSLSIEEMARFYQIADAYVSPYRAEGFNLPVLEAAACGIPIICTAGGATDDFVTDEFALRVESRKISRNVRGQELWHLEPDVDHLVALMRSVVDDSAWRRHARIAGPHHVAASYTWDRAVDVLLRSFLN